MQDLDLRRSAGVHPLYETIFNFTPSTPRRLELPDLRVTLEDPPALIEEFSTQIFITEFDGSLVLEGTPVKRAPVTSDDSITRLAPNPPAGHVERTATVADAAGGKESSATAEDADKKAAQIAALEKQIQDKQKKILPLMRLFVTDEQEFLRNPGDSQVDREIKERRQSEQEELHAETAGLAQLKAKLNELTAAR